MVKSVRFSNYQTDLFIGDPTESSAVVRATNNVKPNKTFPIRYKPPACIFEGCSCQWHNPYCFRTQFHAKIYALRKVRETPTVLSKKRPVYPLNRVRVQYLVQVVEDTINQQSGLVRCAPRTICGVRSLLQ